ncbi:MAG: Holliday junction branch migration protein RuvA, partial [Pseudomonadota bacterium]
MISWLKGQLLAVESESCVLNVSGVGYEVTCSANTLSDIGSLENAELYVHTHVREDQLSLFGFTSLVEKKLFLSLIKVNGIGPKLAITILSAARVSDIVE